MLRVVEAIKRELGLPNEIEGAVPIINAANAANAANAVTGTVSWLHTAVGSFLNPKSENPCRSFLMQHFLTSTMGSLDLTIQLYRDNSYRHGVSDTNLVNSW